MDPSRFPLCINVPGTMDMHLLATATNEPWAVLSLKPRDTQANFQWAEWPVSELQISNTHAPAVQIYCTGRPGTMIKQAMVVAANIIESKK